MGKHLKWLVRSGQLPGSLHSDQWFWFHDKNGPGYACIDHYVVGADTIWVFECKLSQTVEAYGQLFELYFPILRYVYPGKRILCVQVFKNWRYTADTVSDLKACKVGALNCWNLRV